MPKGVFSMKMRDELIARLVSENENFQHKFNFFISIFGDSKGTMVFHFIFFLEKSFRMITLHDSSC